MSTLRATMPHGIGDSRLGHRNPMTRPNPPWSDIFPPIAALASNGPGGQAPRVVGGVFGPPSRSQPGSRACLVRRRYERGRDFSYANSIAAAESAVSTPKATSSGTQGKPFSPIAVGDDGVTGASGDGDAAEPCPSPPAVVLGTAAAEDVGVGEAPTVAVGAAMGVGAGVASGLAVGAGGADGAGTSVAVGAGDAVGLAAGMGASAEAATAADVGGVGVGAGATVAEGAADAPGSAGTVGGVGRGDGATVAEGAAEAPGGAGATDVALGADVAVGAGAGVTPGGGVAAAMEEVPSPDARAVPWGPVGAAGPAAPVGPA